MMTIYTITTDLSSISWEIIIGGFGLFLFGIKFMGDGLKNVAGNRLRDYIDKYTSKPLMGVGIGAIMTVCIQSSSATTAITIGLVRAGLMRLEQAAGIIMGANIGTTMTAFLIGLKIEEYSLYFVFIGSLIVSFASKKTHKYIGEVVLGFGLLFYGLMLMGDALKELKDLPQFLSFAQNMSTNPMLALFAGTVLTAVIQSSSAVIGIVQKIYDTGGMTLSAAIPFILGSNIGTTITGIFAALGGSLASKRAAGVHTTFNIIGTLFAMLLLVPFTALVVELTAIFDLSPMMQIAVAHILFNIVATILFFPFIKQLCAFIRKVLPGVEPERIEVSLDDLNENLIHTLPASALGVTKSAIINMGNISLEGVKACKQYFLNYNSADADHMLQVEDIVNSLDVKITNYLTLIAKEELNNQDMEEYTKHLQTVKNLERISDLSVNIIEFLNIIKDSNGTYSEHANKDILEMLDLIIAMTEKTMKLYETEEHELYNEMSEDEAYLDLLEFKARQRHFERLAKGECGSTVASSVFIDILGTIERIGDHTLNIAKTAIGRISTQDF